MSSPNNLIPVMTSATAPSGVASASSDLGANYLAWHAFDHLGGVMPHAWLSSTATGWLQYQFPTAQVIAGYAVTSAENGTVPRSPKTWTFKGSNDGAAWTVLDTQTNVTDWATVSNVRKVFPLANATAYTYYRLDITASNDATYVGVGDLEMMETAAGAAIFLPVIGSIIIKGMGAR